MNKVLQNPYALYVYCDGAMDYGPKNAGGIGLEIFFPEFVGLESIKKSIGSYEGANIERMELEAIIQGMKEVLEKNSAQMTLPIINKSKWENLTVHYPKSLAEQRAIVGRLEALSAETRRLEEIYESKVEGLEELKRSVLGKAFAGELK